MLQTLGGWSIAVGKPWWLLALVVLLPPLVLLSARSLAGLGGGRRWVAIGLRSLLLTLLVLALAEAQAVRTSDRMTTIFLLDRSQSMPRDWQGRMLDVVNAANLKGKRNEDLSGVVVFGADPKVETPPSPNPPPLSEVENLVDPEHTDLGAAIKLALASFPEDTARRLVIISDGNQNRGDALEQARAAAGLGVSIDALPVRYRYDSEVLVEKVSLPPEVKKGETVNIAVVVRASEPTKGKIQIFQKSDNATVPLGDGQPTEVSLERGLNVLSIKKTIDEPNFYTFSAEFLPDRGGGDRISRNNQAAGFTQARGEAQVLLIEGTAGEHAEFVRALREQKIAVTVLTAPRIDGTGIVAGDRLPSDPAELQPYDCVILGNVPKDALDENQQQLLERSVHDFGTGLVMLGGEQSFGAGGWQNTPVEKALPVDMQIKSTQVMGKSALVMIMHASEIPEGNFWQKKVAQEALKTLSSYDYAGMIHWQGQEAWLFSLRAIGSGKNSMLRIIDSMTPGDMPDFDPSLTMALTGLRKVPDAMTRHVIVISDGDPTPPSPRLVSQFAAAKITVTSVLVAAHGGDSIGVNIMQDLARRTGGRFYNVTNPKALPRIYQKEARLISRPLIYEREGLPWAPRVVTITEPVLGQTDELPGILGLVQTTPKESELVGMPLISPLPAVPGQVVPVLAHWTYGLGRSVAFTSDVGRKWARAWVGWDRYGAFWSQVIRWAMRPVDRGNLRMALQREGGRIKVVVDALDKDDRFLNFLDVRGVAVRPDLGREPVELKQTAPGRYEGVITGAETQGNYFVNLGYRGADGATGLLSAGLAVPYSEEYRELRSDPTILETLASLTGGRVLDWSYRPDGELDLERTLAGVDFFRRDPGKQPPRSFADLWPNLLTIALVLLFFDVAARRLAPDFGRLREIAADAVARLRGEPAVDHGPALEKLQARKDEVGRSMDRVREREPSGEEPGGPLRPIDPNVAATLRGEGPAAAPENRPRPEAMKGPGGLRPTGDVGTDQELSYTERLLAAKRRARESRDDTRDTDKDKGDAPR
jgi:uncharacterized membrane protein/Mg-chelatase subunit ChlD